MSDWMRLTLKTVNDEFAKGGYAAPLVKGGGYFYFRGGEADYWLDKTVNVSTVNSLSLAERGRTAPSIGEDVEGAEDAR